MRSCKIALMLAVAQVIRSSRKRTSVGQLDRIRSIVWQGFTLEHGPAYAHPRRIFAVDELPVGGTGKIDRKAVRERLLALIAANPAPAGSVQ